MKIRCLIENKETPFFIYEHGLSLLINENILFDTGSTPNFIKNAKKLNIDLSKIDTVILSHAHFDHTGGIIDFIKDYDFKGNIYVGEHFLDNKYSFEDDNYVYKGIPFKLDELKTLKYVKNDLKIDKNIVLHNNFTENNMFERINSKFFILDKSYVKDLFLEETVMTVDTDKGLILVVGCSHVGICNIVDEVIRRTNKKIRGIIGGLHLSKESVEYAKKIIEKLKKYDLEFICPIHCSGHEKLFRQEFKNKCKILESGDLFDIDEVKKEYKTRNNKALDEAYGEQTDRNYKDGDRN
ncbi:MAG: MBL fold metallo-hydrolase [Acholeplasmatales bacterium]|nr:MBL fold metallo-hydrolase [Acholeplasmatales bacterium]